MAQHLTIARPYARAAFSEACDSAMLDDWQVALAGLAIVVEQLQVLDVINNPNLSQQQLASLCFDTLKEVVEIKPDLGKYLSRFIDLLLLEKRLNVMPDIERLFHQYLAEHNRIVELSVTSPIALADAQKQQLILALEKRFQSKVTLDYKVEPALIGGLLIKSENWVFDGTIASKLSRLAERIL